MTLRRIKLLFTRNWKEKLLALGLAYLFWIMIRAQVSHSSNPSWQDRTYRAARP